MKIKIDNLASYCEAYQKSVLHPDHFWSEIADHFLWKKNWKQVLSWDFETPNIQWFLGGKLNITENIFERQLPRLANTPAIIWEPNEPDAENRVITYQGLYESTCRFANALLDLGVKKGDRVVIYMPMVPESAISMLACARIGAVHSVVFAGFSAHSLADRINDCAARWVITADGSFRGSKTIELKKIVDEALENATSVEKVVVLKRTGKSVKMQLDRDIWWHEIQSKEKHQASEMDSEDPLFILYTSGSTGKPKGIVHSTGGYMVYSCYSFLNVFQYQQGDIYWCTADVGWITGHSYIVYGPLLAGATTLMFEGTPTYPDPSRFWKIVDKYKVNQFYTAPTAIRALQACGLKPLEKSSLQSLKVIGTVGEPINEEAWHWYHQQIGKGKCPLVDTWWQTETGGIMISALAGITPTKPTFASLPLPGIQPVILNNEGKELTDNNVEGNLCVKFPWPSILRTTYGDHERCKKNYFSAFKGYYFTGDGAKRDHDGYLRIIGRVDDVMNVSGHRIGTAEVENAINANSNVVESAVVGYPHDIKGQGIYAFVICEQTQNMDILNDEIKKGVRTIIGAIAVPDKLQVVPDLPKTRSGKIMRRILRKIASGDVSNFGDTSTLLNQEVVDKIVEGAI